MTGETGRVAGPAIAEAVEKLYDVFGRYPLRSRIDGCPHCVSDDDQARLRSAPLRTLDGSALTRFAHKAISTWGDADDLRHFLPRLFELAVDGEHGDLDLLVRKLEYARWRDWPADERQAIDEFFAALWRATLAGSAAGWRAATLLPILTEVHEEIAPVLTEWRRMSGEPALRQLAELVLETVRTAWFDRAVVDWLVHPATRESLEAGFFRAGSPEVEQVLSDAVEALPWLALARS